MAIESRRYLARLLPAPTLEQLETLGRSNTNTKSGTQGRGAIEQLGLAQKSGDGDFYQQSSVDARLRELRALEVEVRRENKK